MINSRFLVVHVPEELYFDLKIKKTISFNTCNYRFLLLLIYIYIFCTLHCLESECLPYRAQTRFPWGSFHPKARQLSTFSVRGGILKFNVFTSVAHWTSVSRLIRRIEPSTYHSETEVRRCGDCGGGGRERCCPSQGPKSEPVDCYSHPLTNCFAVKCISVTYHFVWNPNSVLYFYFF